MQLPDLCYVDVPSAKSDGGKGSAAASKKVPSTSKATETAAAADAGDRYIFSRSLPSGKYRTFDSATSLIYEMESDFRLAREELAYVKEENSHLRTKVFVLSQRVRELEGTADKLLIGERANIVGIPEHLFGKEIRVSLQAPQDKPGVQKYTLLLEGDPDCCDAYVTANGKAPPSDNPTVINKFPTRLLDKKIVITWVTGAREANDTVIAEGSTGARDAVISEVHGTN